MVKPMANYCSFGYSARVVLGLEKHRTKSRVGNMIRFFIEGIKKQTYNRCPPANRYIARFQHDGKTLVSSDKSDPNAFAGDMAELMVLNIPSVSGGANAWGWTRGIGVKNADVAGLRDTTQSFSDGKLEVPSTKV